MNTERNIFYCHSDRLSILVQQSENFDELIRNLKVDKPLLVHINRHPRDVQGNGLFDATIATGQGLYDWLFKLSAQSPELLKECVDFEVRQLRKGLSFWLTVQTSYT